MDDDSAPDSDSCRARVLILVGNPNSCVALLAGEAERAESEEALEVWLADTAEAGEDTDAAYWPRAIRLTSSAG